MKEKYIEKTNDKYLEKDVKIKRFSKSNLLMCKIINIVMSGKHNLRKNGMHLGYTNIDNLSFKDKF
jgi:hypothetical protein